MKSDFTLARRITVALVCAISLLVAAVSSADGSVTSSGDVAKSGFVVSRGAPSSQQGMAKDVRSLAPSTQSVHYPRTLSATTTTLSLLPASPQQVGTTLVLSALVTGSGSPTGTVNFEDQGATITGCGAVTISSGVASCNDVPTTAGTHSFSVLYSGDVTNASSVSSFVSFVVTAAPGAPGNVSVSSITNGTAAVSWTASMATGNYPVLGYTVTSTYGSNVTGPTCTITASAITGSSNPSCTVPNIPVGVSITFSVTATSAGGTSAPTAITVNSATSLPNSSVLLTASPAAPQNVGTPVTFSAQVPSGATGTINFELVTASTTASIPGCAARVINAGYANCTTSSLVAGSSGNNVIAVYSGDSNTAGSSSATFNYVISSMTLTQPSSQLTITSVYGLASAAYTLTTSGGSGTGAVTFTVTNGTATGCAVSGTALTATSAGTCLVTASSAIYTPGELYSSSNPSATCFTCNAAQVTGSAPPSNTLNSGTSVNAMTGDFSTGLNLFSAPAIGGGLSLSLSYDSQLAQSQLANGTSPGPFGYGWSSDFSASVTAQSGSTPTPSITVNQGNGSEVTFNQSANSGTSFACESPGQTTPSGSYPSTAKYTVSGSNHQWCALSSVQGQLSDPNTSGITYQTQGGQSIDDFAWNGQLTEVTTNADAASPPVAGTFILNDVNGGFLATTAAGVPLSQQCPSGATCTIVYATDGRSLVEEFNSSNLVTTVISPSGTVYNLTYDTSNDLVSVSKPQTSSSTATWHYAYATSSPSPYQSDLVQIYDPDATFNASSPSNPGAAHSTSIAYYSTSSTPSTPGMVSSLEDGTGAITSYSYADACASGQCVGAGSSQSTTILYPPETPCPGATGCTPQSPVEVDQYSNGLEISTQLGSTAANGPGDETWSYNWNYGNGTANSVELITYPNTQNASIAAPTASILTDPAGNIVSTTNALGDVATSYYNDTGGNDLNELLWSYPGPVANPSATAPAGSSTYSYNVYGQVVTETDPVGNTTSFGYYQSDSLLCFTAPPSVQLSSIPTCSSSLTTSDVGAVGAPSDATTYSYDAQGDVIATTLDNNDAGGDPQTTTASYDVLGNQLWSIPATGQSLGQSAANPFATSTTYSLASQPLVTHAPDGQVTTNTYDTVGNLTSSTNNAATTTTVYDADNRACYSVVASATLTGLTCTSLAQAGSSATTYVPGSLALATRTDANNNKTSYYYADLAYPSSPTEIVDPMASEVSYTAYDDLGNACLSGDVSPTFGVAQCTWTAQDTGHTYNALGAVTTITDPNGLVTTNYYDDASFPTNLTRTMNSLGKVTSYTYDADGRLLTTTNPSGSAESVNYTVNGQTCQKEPTATVYPCYEGPAIAGVSEFTYNNAGELTSMNDNVGAPSAATWSQATQYSYANGQLLSTTNPSGATLTYAYNNAGQVSCIGYPVSTSTNCAAPASSTNTIATKSYDNAGRLSSLSDWLGNTTTYSYGDANDPGAPTTISYPSSTGLNLSYGYDPAGNLTSLTAGTLHDTWTYNPDEQQLVASLNGTTSSPATYNANGQVTAATNLATSTSNDTFALAANGQINADQAPSGAATSFSYVASSAELCNVATSSTPCGTTPQNGTSYTYNADGQRASATTSTAGVTGATTSYSYNALGELCSVGSNSNCGTTPSSGVTYSYNGLGLRVSATTATSSTTSTWDTVSNSLPENLNDATTSASATTSTSYLYGDALFGSSAPSEQISMSASGTTVAFLIIIPEGVQEVVSSSGSVLEQASYSTYGVQTVSSGSLVTPYGFQGAYRDATGLIYLINRYYDPSTDSFLSVDPAVQQTDQPYVFVDGDPLNSTDPLGLRFVGASSTLQDHQFSYVPTPQSLKYLSMTPVVTYTTTRISVPIAPGVSISISTGLEAKGPNAISNVSVETNGNVSVTAGSAVGSFSAGSTYSNGMASNAISYSYSQTKSVGTGQNKDSVTVNVTVTLSSDENGTAGPDYKAGGAGVGIVGAGSGAAWLWNILKTCGLNPVECGA